VAKYKALAKELDNNHPPLRMEHDVVASSIIGAANCIFYSKIFLADYSKSARSL